MCSFWSSVVKSFAFALKRWARNQIEHAIPQVFSAVAFCLFVTPGLILLRFVACPSLAPSSFLVCLVTFLRHSLGAQLPPPSLSLLVLGLVALSAALTSAVCFIGVAHRLSGRVEYCLQVTMMGCHNLMHGSTMSPPRLQQVKATVTCPTLAKVCSFGQVPLNFTAEHFPQACCGLYSRPSVQRVQDTRSCTYTM